MVKIKKTSINLPEKYKKISYEMVLLYQKQNLCLDDHKLIQATFLYAVEILCQQNQNKTISPELVDSSDDDTTEETSVLIATGARAGGGVDAAGTSKKDTAGGIPTMFCSSSSTAEFYRDIIKLPDGRLEFQLLLDYLHRIQEPVTSGFEKVLEK